MKRPKPWTNQALDYTKRSNWPKIAKEMLLENSQLPASWAFDDLATRVWMEETFQFDCALWPNTLWRYLCERLPVLVLKLDSKDAPPAQTKAEARPS
jgi:hypothetical protein